MTHRTQPHDWHVLDAERGIEVRQATANNHDNRWICRSPLGEVELDDDQFDRLRAGGELPEALR